MWPFNSAYPEVRIGDILDEYDYIIVGGGTAGCVLANRLSQSPNITVLLVERGPLADSWASRVPLLSADFASDGSRTQTRVSEYQPEIGRSIDLCTGSVLGGSSRINQMIYLRGLEKEYDMWKEKTGCKGWGWDDVSALFKKSEKAVVDENGNVDQEVHGTTGEWCNQGSADLQFPGFDKIISACSDIGLPFISDINSHKQRSLGTAKLSFTRNEDQHRHSTYHAFLPKDLVLKRHRNLHIATNIIVEKIKIEQDNNPPERPYVARGVHIVTRTDSGNKKPKRKTVRTRNEVILCAGPFGSPHILMLSGIGPAGHLTEHNIDVVKDLPAVGSNLQDHFGVAVSYRVSMGDSLLVLEKRPWIFLIELFRYLLFGTGMLLAPVVQLAIFASSLLLDARGMPITNEKSAERDTLPDLEILPLAYDCVDHPFDKSEGVFSLLNVLLNPKSSGTVRLSSADPQAPLHIDPRYLSDPADLIPLRASLRLSQRIVANMRLHGYAIRDWENPQEGDDDMALDKFIKKRNRTTYHYSSTCRMALSEDAAGGGGVVDEELKVFGVLGLRVADSSVFPWVIRTHLQAPTVCVAEKCAEMVLDENKDKNKKHEAWEVWYRLTRLKNKDNSTTVFKLPELASE